MNKQNLVKPNKLTALGRQGLLLTEAESRCFYIARDYQRRSLLRSLAPVELRRWRAGFNKLGWSKNPLVLAIQWLVLLIALVPMLVWLAVKSCVRILLFPIRYLRTYTVPKDLRAPGEKTLVGIHNAFSRHLNLSAADYVACINDWIRILYGQETVMGHDLERFVDDEREKYQDRGVAATTRSLLAISREKLSKQLGHYGQSKHLH